MRLRGQLRIVVVGTLLPMLAFSVAILLWVHRQAREATERGLVDTARAVSVAVDRELGGTIAALQVLGASDHLQRRRTRLIEFYDVARDAVATQPAWQNVVLYSPIGDVLVNTLLPRGTPPRPRGNVEPVSRAIRDRTAVVSDLFSGRITNRPIVSVVASPRPTPTLNGIIGFAQLMHDGKVGPVSGEHREYLGDILMSARHLLQLINDILDLAKRHEGTGLGLALTKRLVEAQGGHVGVRSTPGQGSLFFAVLPRVSGPDGRPPDVYGYRLISPGPSAPCAAKGWGAMAWPCSRRVDGGSIIRNHSVGHQDEYATVHRTMTPRT